MKTTLIGVDTGQLDAFGNGTLELAPPVGQNWAPLFVRISANSQITPVPYCAVYHGSPGVPPQPSQFIDDTFLGNGDTSSMISGTPVRFGESIIFKFAQGNPGDTVTATVYGINSDLPPNLDVLPQVPGTHFAGHPSTEVVKIVNSQRVLSNLTSGSLLLIPSVGVMDMRQYSSFYFTLTATAFFAATGFNPVQVTFDWYSDNAQTQRIFRDQFTFWGDNTTPGVFFVGNGSIRYQDVCHGAFLQVRVFNGAAADTMQVSWEVTGTTRLLTGPGLKQDTGTDGDIVNSDGAPTNIACPITYGRLALRMTNTSGAGINFNLSLAGFPGSETPYEVFQVAAGTTSRQEIIVPKRALLVNPTGNYTLFIFSLFDKTY